MTTSQLSSASVQTLERHLTAERLGPYRRAVGGELAGAVRLYHWNSLASGAMFEVLGHVEVVLRNALDRHLQEWHEASGRSGDWWDDPFGLLEPKRRADARTARERVRRQQSHDSRRDLRAAHSV